MSSVLKAGAASPELVARSLRPSVHEPTPAVAQPGRWVTEAELKSLLDEAFEAGRKQGAEHAEKAMREVAKREAERNAKVELDAALAEHTSKTQRAQAEKWRGLATALAGQMQALREQLEAEVTEWSFVATTRLLGTASETQVVQAVRQVLQASGLNEPLELLVHPEDFAALQDDPAEWPPGVSFGTDPSIELGGCLIKTARETLDARLEVQLRYLRDALDAARRERAGGQG